jgi:hypothetical protein
LSQRKRERIEYYTYGDGTKADAHVELLAEVARACLGMFFESERIGRADWVKWGRGGMLACGPVSLASKERNDFKFERLVVAVSERNRTDGVNEIPAGGLVLVGEVDDPAWDRRSEGLEGNMGREDRREAYESVSAEGLRALILDGKSLRLLGERECE